MPLPAVLGIPLLIGGILSGAASVDALFGSRVWNWGCSKIMLST